MTPAESVAGNAAGAARHFGRLGEGAVSREVGPALLVAARTAVVGAFHNAALRWDRDGSADDVVTAARAFAAEFGRDVVLWVAVPGDEDLDGAARAAGFAERGSVIGMVADEPPGDVAGPVGVDVSEVVDGAGVAAFASVHERLFGAAEPVAHFASPGALLDPAATAVVARVDGRPAACAMTITTASGAGTDAGVYWVATVPEARRRGLGTVVTRAVTRQAFAAGAGRVVLQATAAGRGLYRRLGFRGVTTHRRYLVHP